MSSDRLKIGILSARYEPAIGGVETHTRTLAAELVARGHRVFVLCLDDERSEPLFSMREELRDDVRVRRAAYAYQDHSALADLVRHSAAEEAVLAWVTECELDVVHVHHLTGFGAGVLSRLKERGVATVMTLHDYWMLCPRGQMLRPERELCEAPNDRTCGECLARTWPHLMPSLEGEPRGPEGEDVSDDTHAASLRTNYALRALTQPAVLFVPSRAARDVFVRAGVDRARLEVCENGFDADGLRKRVEAQRSDSQLSWQFRLRLGVLGTVLPAKGVFELACALLDVDMPSLTLEVYGPLVDVHGDPTYRQGVEEIAEVDQRVRLHGPYTQGQLPEILAQLDCVAAPALWNEVFGLTVREARAVGLPVLVSDRGGLPELVQDGGGLVVPAGDHRAWVRSIRMFATDVEARRRWRSAPAKIRGVAAMTDQIERGYRAALRGATPVPTTKH